MKFLRCLKSIIHLDSEVKEFLSEQEKNGRELDRRLDNISKATLDGEEEWFLDLIKKDPKCAIEVIKECGFDNLADNVE